VVGTVINVEILIIGRTIIVTIVENIILVKYIFGDVETVDRLTFGKTITAIIVRHKYNG
jgi:hypothetical protein